VGERLLNCTSNFFLTILTLGSYVGMLDWGAMRLAFIVAVFRMIGHRKEDRSQWI
jgi:hypothetical protein